MPDALREVPRPEATERLRQDTERPRSETERPRPDRDEPRNGPRVGPDGNVARDAGQPDAPKLRAYFSPGGGATDAVVREIDAAREKILIQAYSFTSSDIARALLRAHRRGVQVELLVDKNEALGNHNEAQELERAGIPTYLDGEHAIAHNKVMLIDGRTIITGSFNFTKAAERANAENLLVIRNDPQLYAEYERNFEHHRQHSVRAR